MCGIIKEERFPVDLEKERVLRNLGCVQGTVAYAGFAEEYDAVIRELIECLDPAIYMKKGLFPAYSDCEEFEEGDTVLYVLCTVGEEISRKSTEAFAKGDYVKGMLADAVADEALFSVEKRLEEILRQYCREHGTGIGKRFSADAKSTIPLQRFLFEELEAGKRGFYLSEGYMIRPVKTNAVFFQLTEDETVFRAEHDCARCSMFSCGKRTVKRLEITVLTEGKTYCFTAEAGKTLLEILQQEKLYDAAPCGGNGRCGKCMVQVRKGVLPLSEAEKERISTEKQREGWRLACRAVPQMNLTIVVPEQEEEQFQAITAKVSVPKIPEEKEEGWGIGIDIGTTTIAMHGIWLKGGSVFATWTGVNHQRAYGADVISRIESSLKGNQEILKECIRKDLVLGIRELLKKAGKAGKPERICITGNTVMLHLFLGYNCLGLSRTPFLPVSLKAETYMLSDLIRGTWPDVPVNILPGIAPFVGADIMAGIYQCDMDARDEVCMLIDVGTNGEIALGDRKGLLCASTAAGPAFEGGNISCGMGSLPGAICSVELAGGRVGVRTIQDKPVRGICGSGVLEALAELFRAGIVDEAGRLESPFFEEGFVLAKTEGKEPVVLTQRDIREIQLAKAAIRAGIETLLKRSGTDPFEVKKVFLAGGFGFSMNLEKAFCIGMFPEGFRGKIETVGNSSAAGCLKYLTEKDAEKRMSKIKELAVEVELSADRDFAELFVEHMELG